MTAIGDAAEWKTVTSEIASLLKRAGFERSGATFIRRQAEGVVTQVTIEKFCWNSAVQRRFRLMLTIYLPDRSGHAFSPKDWHPHYTPALQESSGTLSGHADFWFDLPFSLPDEQFGAELRRHMSDEVLSFFDRCSGIDGVIAVLEEENRKRGKNFFSFALATALAKLGRTEESRKHFRQSLGEPSLIRQVAGNYGIRLDD